MLMFVTTGWTDKHFIPTVFCYAMFYGGFGQFVAGALEVGSCRDVLPLAHAPSSRNYSSLRFTCGFK